MLRTAAKQVLCLFPPKLQHAIRSQYDARKLRRRRDALATIGARDVAVADINHLLHHLRGVALAQLPKGVKHFVSVGCSGTWYFNWVEQMCWPLHHTGIEFYVPKPSDLPANTDWIANTAANMEMLEDGTADLLFSGQNIEHLWPQDIGNFLLESHRVLREGGLLVIDSPNRRVTSLLQWSQPEHTIELDLPEIVQLLELAGFDLERKEGLWLCEVRDTGAVLPFDELTVNGPWPLTRRVAEAKEQVESAFIWWVEARRSNRHPDVARLRERIRQIHAIAWPERLNRLKTVIGRRMERNGQTWFDSEGHGGPLLYGPYTAMPGGRHKVTFTLDFPNRFAQPRAGATVQVTAANGTKVLASKEISTDTAEQEVQTAVLEFELADTTFAVEFVVLAAEGVRMRAMKAVSVISDPDPA